MYPAVRQILLDLKLPVSGYMENFTIRASLLNIINIFLSRTFPWVIILPVDLLC